MSIREAASGSSGGGRLRLGFSRSVHLRKRADFERVYKEGRRHFSPHLTLFFRRREAIETLSGSTELVSAHAGTMRTGFTVGRVLGGAVDRNRIKRRLREAVRHEQMALLTPVDVVIHPKKSVLKLDFAMLRAEMAAGFAMVELGRGAAPQPRPEGKFKFKAKAKANANAKAKSKSKPRPQAKASTSSGAV